jgi:hypothetical protein
MDDGSGFLSRWARRKAAARSSSVAAVPPVPPPQPAAAPALPEVRGAAPAMDIEPDEAAALPPSPPLPPPTLDDVAGLTPQADFGRFMAGDVDPGVRNAAMKKLFSDPHYNVMDGLDTYIDDYGKPDPIPQSMLRGLAQSRLLGLFDNTTDDTPRDQPDHATAAAVSTAELDRTHDEDPDLQLQPDDAARARTGEPGGAYPGGDPASKR